MAPKPRLAFLQIYDPKRNSLSFECIYPPTVRANLTAQLGQERLLARLHASGGRIGISGRAAQTGQSYVVADAKHDSDYLEVDPTTRSELDVPLIDRGKAIGVLSIESDQLNAFDENDRATLEGLAAMAVIAIRNVEQYEALEDARHMLEVARERDLYDLASVLVHRIGNVLGDVPYQLTRIRQQVGPNMEVEQAATHIEQRVHGLKGLGDALHTLVDLQGISEERLEVGHCLEEILLHIGDSRSLMWELDLPPAPIWILGNRAFLCDALTSVVENAYEAMDWQGTIRIEFLQPKAQVVEIRVTDTGSGIPSHIHDRVFQLGVSTKTDPDRERGRGLFTCKAIIQKHRGTVGFTTESGHGTTFMITLPTIA